MENLKFPIGQFRVPYSYSAALTTQSIDSIEAFPILLKSEVQHLSTKKLNTTYRPGGWTIRQVVHHCADSHMNSYMRFKLALTEDNPTIKPYFEHLWADLVDGKNMPVEPSLKIIEGLHEKWAKLLRNLSKEELLKTFIHPEQDKEISLRENIAFYAWHCRHHLAHIRLVTKA